MNATQTQYDTTADTLPFVATFGHDQLALKQSDVHGVHVLAIGDPHFRLENMETLPAYISKILELIREQKLDFVVILGDMLHCHERLHTTVLNKAYRFVNDIRQLTEVYVLVGNHDYINNSQFLSTHHWMNAMKEWSGVHIVDTGAVRHTAHGTIVFCPYVFPGRFKEALDIIDTDWKSARAIFCHQEFRGCKMGAIESVDGDAWDACYPFVVSGHVHDRQTVGSNVFYTGSSLQHAFGEKGDKTVSICRFREKIIVENIGLDMPVKRTMYMDVEELRNFSPMRDSAGNLRITVSGTSAEFKVFRKTQKYKRLVDSDIKVVFRQRACTVANDATRAVKGFKSLLSEAVNTHKDENVAVLYKRLFLE